MFDNCKIKKSMCAFATKSTYDPIIKKNTWEEFTFCGAMSGVSDTRIDKLEKCWIEMSKHQQTKYKKSMV